MSIQLPGFTMAELEARGAIWTAREILQQPKAWPQVAQLVARERRQLDAFLDPVLSNPALRVVLSGAGTSAYIGRCLAPALSLALNRRVEAVPTTDVVSGPRQRLPPDVPTLLVSFGRSGNSPESVATVDLAEQALAHVHHLIITCSADGALARRASSLRSAHVIVLPDAVNDRGFAMTSSFTSMLLTAALAFGVVRSDAVESIARTAEMLLPKVWPLAERLIARGFRRVVYLGSNELGGVASEAALKMLELTDGKTVAIAESTLGFRHGPKTIIDDRTLVVVMLSNDAYARAYDRDLLVEVRRDARAGSVLAISARADDLAGGEHLLFEDASQRSDVEIALLHILFAQAFALLQSLALGLTPDNPNAAGVVNRVVQGVTIHPWRENDTDVPGR
jgi:tagatose-6-phosphate ketose/aldose isomerase